MDLFIGLVVLFFKIIIIFYNFNFNNYIYFFILIILFFIFSFFLPFLLSHVADRVLVL